MTPTIVLDAGPLSMVTNPLATGEAQACSEWLESVLSGGATVFVPEIADYELRLELLRAGKTQGLQRLNGLGEAVGYLPLTTENMRRAAQFWAQARAQGKTTADDRAFDADVILAAQAARLADQRDDVVIATTNVGHLGLFADAKEWRDIERP